MTTRETQLWIAIALIFAAAFSRLLPHPYNFTPLGGMALFAGAAFRKWSWSWTIPFLGLWVSDLILNNTVYARPEVGFQWFSDPGVLLAFAGIFLMGRLAVRWRPMQVLGLSLSASLLFFLVTNFTVWAGPQSFYTKDLSGLLSCYAAGIPFFGGTIAGDLFYSTLIFGGWFLVNRSKHQELIPTV